jgi:organic radical activating enzyme
MCSYCSANIPKVNCERRKISTPAEVWAEGLNRRCRHTILAGGEPFLYPEFSKLISLLDKTYKVEIYTNLGIDVTSFLNSTKRTFTFLVSLHDTVKDLDLWYKDVERLIIAGNSVRFHVVRVKGWEIRKSFLESKGHKVTTCDNQNTYNKSKGAIENLKYPLVECSTNAFFFGPDGYRYSCVTRLGKGDIEARFEHISELDREDYTTVQCGNWGLCAGCDNLAQGYTVYKGDIK